MQIFNEDETTIYATVLAIPNYRLTAFALLPLRPAQESSFVGARAGYVSVSAPNPRKGAK